jgi:uncharacterized protein
MTAVQVLVIAKAPVAGRVKTRLCPPCTPAGAAAVAAAALLDTLDAVSATAAAPTLVLSGRYAAPAGWRSVPQRGDELGERLACAFADTGRPGTASLLVGMDTPQLDAGLLAAVIAGLGAADAVLAPAADGGWWALALRDPRHAQALRGVPMSRADTGERTAAALRAAGLTVAAGPLLRDVDTADDARAVAAMRPLSRFAAAVRDHVPPVERAMP